MDECPICLVKGGQVISSALTSDVTIVCAVCGQIRADPILINNLPKILADAFARARLRHWLLKSPNRTHPLDLTQELLDRILAEPLPTPRVQADNLVRHIGARTKEQPGHPIYFNPTEVAPIIGSLDDGVAKYVFAELLESKLIGPSGMTTPSSTTVLNDPCWLTFRGWDRYEELLHSHSEGRIAFMAMPFGDSMLDKMYSDCFIPAVESAGFTLRRIIDAQGAGLIDDQLRVEIRRCRFLISELTYKNPGAYWEAGFAEGIGKPVIYTCQESYFNAPETKPHFDTNHWVTVLWDEAALELAKTKLLATIRATLPHEAL